MKNKIKRIILMIKERIYFKDVSKIKNNVSSLVIPVEKTNISLDKASYHGYYIKYKKNDRYDRYDKYDKYNYKKLA